MRTKLVCLLMFFSATAFAQTATTNDQDWEAASIEVQSEHFAGIQNGSDAQLELSHPWQYGRDDSDTIVGRNRDETSHD